MIPFDLIKERICDAIKKDSKSSDLQLTNIVIDYNNEEINMDCFSEEEIVAEYQTNSVECIVFR